MAPHPKLPYEYAKMAPQCILAEFQNGPSMHSSLIPKWPLGAYLLVWAVLAEGPFCLDNIGWSGVTSFETPGRFEREQFQLPCFPWMGQETEKKSLKILKQTAA